MKNTKIIPGVNSKVIDFIKIEISNKKERHIKMIESINPVTIAKLKRMKKIG